MHIFYENHGCPMIFQNQTCITGCEKSIGPPCHTKFDLFSIVLGKSDETMPYRLDLGNSFGVVYIAVTYLVQELC